MSGTTTAGSSESDVLHEIPSLVAELSVPPRMDADSARDVVRHIARARCVDGLAADGEIYTDKLRGYNETQDRDLAYVHELLEDMRMSLVQSDLADIAPLHRMSEEELEASYEDVDVSFEAFMEPSYADAYGADTRDYGRFNVYAEAELDDDGEVIRLPPESSPGVGYRPGGKGRRITPTRSLQRCRGHSRSTDTPSRARSQSTGALAMLRLTQPANSYSQAELA